VSDSLAMLLESAESAPQQARIQLASGCLRKNRHGWERDGGSRAAQRGSK